MGHFAPAMQPVKLNIALCGPSGAGKTRTALQLATALAGRVAVIDTEHASSALYRQRFPHEVAALRPPYAPERYLELLTEAVQAGFGAVVIDSLTPEWDGPGGCLALKEEAERRDRTNSWTAWRSITPRHEALLGAINRAPCHVVTTFRVKPAHEQVVGADGRKTVVSRGDAPVTRERFEYEYDLVCQLDVQHRATVLNTRLEAFPVGSSALADDAWVAGIAAYARPAEAS